MAGRKVPPLTLTCAHCSASFERMPGEYAKKLRRGQIGTYCSLSCAAIAHNDVRRVERKPCNACGKTLVYTDRLFCSPRCRDTVRARSLTPIWCLQCSSQFRPRNSRSRYCGKTCADQAHSKRMMGSANSHYKDGTSYAKWFCEMRPLVKARDGFACAVCHVRERLVLQNRLGKSRGRSNLQVHHINERPSDNRSENLITLCHPCHRTHHNARLNSTEAPWGWFGDYALHMSAAMSPAWKLKTVALQAAFLPAAMHDAQAS